MQRGSVNVLIATLSALILVVSALPIGTEHQNEVGAEDWPWSCPTFGDLAKNAIAEEFEGLIPVLQSTFDNPNVQPLDTVDARRRLLKIRNYLDVFAPAYPVEPAQEPDVEISETEHLEESGSDFDFQADISVEVSESDNVGKKTKEDKDLFSEIRKELDSGYELIGVFKDIGEDHIKDPKVEDGLRKGCLTWYHRFMSKSQKSDYAAFLAKPDLADFHRHTKWSKFFWKADPDMFPTKGMSGQAVLELLLKLQFEQIRKREVMVLGMSTILDHALHEDFHDFRKSIRAVFREDQMFGKLVWSKDAKKDMKLLAHAYHKLGKLNDKWNKWWFYHKHGDKQEAKLAKEVDADWKKLQAQLKKWDLPAVTARLESMLLEPCKL